MNNLQELAKLARLVRLYVNDKAAGVDKPLRDALANAFWATHGTMRADKSRGFAYWLGGLDFSEFGSTSERQAADELVRIADEAILVAA